MNERVLMVLAFAAIAVIGAVHSGKVKQQAAAGGAKHAVHDDKDTEPESRRYSLSEANSVIHYARKAFKKFNVKPLHMLVVERAVDVAYINHLLTEVPPKKHPKLAMAFQSVFITSEKPENYFIGWFGITINGIPYAWEAPKPQKFFKSTTMDFKKGTTELLRKKDYQALWNLWNLS